MAQFNEVFGAGLGGGDLVARRVGGGAVQYKELTVQLKGELEKAAQAEAAHQEHFSSSSPSTTTRGRPIASGSRGGTPRRSHVCAICTPLGVPSRSAPEVYAEPMAAAACNARRAAAKAAEAAVVA